MVDSKKNEVFTQIWSLLIILVTGLMLMIRFDYQKPWAQESEQLLSSILAQAADCIGRLHCF